MDIQSSTIIPVLHLAEGSNQATVLRLDPPPASLNDACMRLPGGAYTTLRTYETCKVLRLEDHFQRLETSARLSGTEIHLHRDILRRALRQLVDQEPLSKDYRIRVILDLEQSPGDVYLVRGSLQVPSPESYEQGVSVIVTSLGRNLPTAKLTKFLETAAAVELPRGINEALMVNPEGRILEGLSSNFYAVISDVIWTAGEGVLEGITRRLVLEEARADGMKIHFEPASVSDIPRMQEAFISSTSRAVLPVNHIDGQPIGKGEAGPVARRLLKLYQARLGQELEELSI
jgi:branched-chain amino acid aminotransferase